MYSACAIESYVENFDLEKYIEKNKYITPKPMTMIGSSAETDKMNMEIRRAYLSERFYCMYETSVETELAVRKATAPELKEAAEARLSNLTYGPVAASDIPEFLDLYKGIDGLDKISLGNVLTGRDLRLNEDALKEGEAWTEETYGGKMEDRVIELNIDGDDWLLFAQMVEYDGRWFIFDVGGSAGATAGVSVQQGGLIKSSEFEEMW